MGAYKTAALLSATAPRPTASPATSFTPMVYPQQYHLYTNITHRNSSNCNNSNSSRSNESIFMNTEYTKNWLRIKTLEVFLFKEDILREK